MKKIILLLLFFVLCNFTTFSQLQSPILVKPPVSADMVQLNTFFDWSDIDNAQYYELEISTDPDFNSLIPFILPQLTISEFTCPNGVLEQNTQYFWRVRTITSGGALPYSQVFSFRTIGTPGQEVTNLISDVNELVSNYQLNSVQGNILDNWLDATYHLLALNNIQPAKVHLELFKNRVQILEESNMLSPENGDALQENAVGILELIQNDNFHISGTSIIPNEFVLKQNYPNPFNPETTIEYSIPQSGNVSLKIYDISGKEIATLIDKYQEAGSYITMWNANGYSSGIYFYRLTTNENTTAKRMILTK